MGTAPRMWTVEEFLDWERQQDERYEFVDGIIRAMVGGTVDHHTICLNIGAALKGQLRGGSCRVFVEGIKILAAGATAYPDVVVNCGSLNPKADMLLEPVLVIEVLSRSTADFDRGRKWAAYQQIPSLMYFALVAQDQRRVDVYERQDGAWTYRVLSGDGELQFDRLGCRLTLATIYEDTSLAAAAG